MTSKISWRDALKSYNNEPPRQQIQAHGRRPRRISFPDSQKDMLKLEKYRKHMLKKLNEQQPIMPSIEDRHRLNLEIEQELAVAKMESLSLQAGKPKSQSVTHIPQFYRAQPADNEAIAFKLREEARALFLQLKTNELLDNDELTHLWSILENNLINPLDQKEQAINYRTFRKVARELQSFISPEKLQKFFTSTTFLKIYDDDPYGRINIAAFFNYVMKKTWLQQTRIGICLYDCAGHGYLREVDLESYIYELIPTLPALQAPYLEKQFESFYVCTACRKFYFYLDPMRTGKIKIQDILACSFLDDLLELRDEDLSKDAQAQNWFSSYKAYMVYGAFLTMDVDMNGMLSKSELKMYGTGTLTPQFIDRVFEECVTYQGEMDYKTYLDLVIALENLSEIAAQQWIFRILDMNHNGRLTHFELNYYFRGINDFTKIRGDIQVDFDDVKDEIFDMVKPKNPACITFKDLVDSGQGETVLQILIDYKGFWNYEHREDVSLA